MSPPPFKTSTVSFHVGGSDAVRCFFVSLRVLDVPAHEVSATEAFAAWSLVRLLASVPITPGGVGIVELGLTSALVGFGGNNAGVVAAVLVYRALTVVPTLVLGLLAAATWRSHHPGPLQADTGPTVSGIGRPARLRRRP